MLSFNKSEASKRIGRIYDLLVPTKNRQSQLKVHQTG